MPVGERRYLSYLLRLWCTKQDGCEIWRASLEDTRTGEVRGFASLESLIDFLREQMQAIGEEPSMKRPEG